MARQAISDTAFQLLDVQTLQGQGVGYRAQNTVGVMSLSDTVVIPMSMTYTPVVNAWWEVEAHVGIVYKTDATYSYTYVDLTLSPADVDGQIQAKAICMQHASVQTYEHYNPRRIWKLNAGVTYTCASNFEPTTGTWQYHTGPGFLWMQAKAWTR